LLVLRWRLLLRVGRVLVRRRRMLLRSGRMFLRGWPLLLVLPALLGQAAVLWFGLRHEHFGSILRTELLATALFAVAVLGLRRYRGPAAGPLVLAGALLLQLAALGAG